VNGPVTTTGTNSPIVFIGANSTTIEAGVTAGSIGVGIASGTIAINSGGVLSGPLVDIDSGSGGITENGNGSIVAGTLTSSLRSNGNVDLGNANSVGTLADFIVNGGTFHLTNSGTTGLAVDGA